MIRLTRRLASGFGLFLLASASAHAAFNVQVNAVHGLVERVKLVTVMPMACPATVDCLWIEDRLRQGLIRLASLRVVAASRVRHVMFEMEIETVTDEDGQPSPRSLASIRSWCH